MVFKSVVDEKYDSKSLFLACLLKFDHYDIEFNF